MLKRFKFFGFAKNFKKYFSDANDKNPTNRNKSNFYEGSSEEFFYNNPVTSNEEKNIIKLKDEEKSKMRSKLKINEVTPAPLIEDEAYRDLYRNFSLYVGEELTKELDEISHNTEKEGKLYKYGLPAKNELPFTQLVLKEDAEQSLPKTPTENLFEMMGLDSDSSYENLILKIQSEFNHGRTN